MTTITENRRLFYAVMYFVVACVIAAALMGCSPYNPMPEQPQGTPTPAPGMTASKSANVQISTPTPRPSCVTVGSLNVRSQPGTAARVLFTLRPSEVVTVLQAGAWHKVQAGNRPGYINSKFCE